MEWKKRDDAATVQEVVLRNRGGISMEEFNSESVKHEIPDLDKAVNVIHDAVSRHDPITVFGDYDADGIDSTAILKMLFNYLGVEIRTRMPHRFSEGYGLSEHFVDEVDKGLLITIDNGIAAVEAVKKAKDQGLTVLVIDHHLIRDDGILPDADVIIDPNVIEGQCDFKPYCGSGLAYKLAEKMVKDTRLLNKMKCFAAIGTVADVMPLVGENRLIVQEGMRNMEQVKYRTTGLSAVMYAKNLDAYVTAKDIGFSIGPMLNAAGRLLDDGAELALKTLMFDGPLDEAKQLAAQLNDLNEQRKMLVKEATKKADDKIRDDCMYGDHPYVLYLEGISEGIVGIIAGKIAEKYATPCFVFTDTDDPRYIKGSGRNGGVGNLKILMDDINARLSEIIDEDGNPMSIWKFGGHAGAGALTLDRRYFYEFQSVSQELCPASDADENDTMYYDLEIDAKDVIDAYNEMDQYGPFGEGNPELVFKINNFQTTPQYYGFYQTTGDLKDNIRFASKECSANGFGLAQKFFEEGSPAKMNLLGNITLNTYRTASVQIEVLDLEKVEEETKKTSLARLLAEKAASR